MAAVTARGEALRHVAPSLLGDPALILAAARKGAKSDGGSEHTPAGWFIGWFISWKILENPKVVDDLKVATFFSMTSPEINFEGTD